MRIVVDYALCDSHALCTAEAPEVFEVGDDDRLHILIDSPGEDLRAKIEAAVRVCPKQALSIEEDSE
jgi:ferredoxin